MSTRVGIVVSHPIQYQAPFFRQLASRGILEPHVFFMTEHGVRESFDSGFGQVIQYDIPLTDGYSHEFVPNISPLAFGTPLGTINPGLAQAIARSRIDGLVVHGWAHISMWIAYATALIQHVPYALRSEATLARTAGVQSRIHRTMIGSLVRHASACLAIGSLNRDFYFAYGAPISKVFDAPYSVDTDRFRIDGAAGVKNRDQRLRDLGLNTEWPTIVVSAKLQRHKRPLDVIQAADRAGINLNLIFLGAGPLRSEIDQAAATRPWVRLLGFVNQVQIAEWYGCADLIVLASEHEPWGLAINEAMAAGAMPIVSDRVGCGPDLVKDFGYIYPVGDIDSLASCIRQACARLSTDLREEASNRSESYGISATCEGYEAAFESILR